MLLLDNKKTKENGNGYDLITDEYNGDDNDNFDNIFDDEDYRPVKGEDIPF